MLSHTVQHSLKSHNHVDSVNFVLCQLSFTFKINRHLHWKFFYKPNVHFISVVVHFLKIDKWIGDTLVVFLLGIELYECSWRIQRPARCFLMSSIIAKYNHMDFFGEEPIIGFFFLIKKLHRKNVKICILIVKNYIILRLLVSIILNSLSLVPLTSIAYWFHPFQH